MKTMKVDLKMTSTKRGTSLTEKAVLTCKLHSLLNLKDQSSSRCIKTKSICTFRRMEKEGTLAVKIRLANKDKESKVREISEEIDSRISSIRLLQQQLVSPDRETVEADSKEVISRILYSSKHYRLNCLINLQRVCSRIFNKRNFRSDKLSSYHSKMQARNIYLMEIVATSEETRSESKVM